LLKNISLDRLTQLYYTITRTTTVIYLTFNIYKNNYKHYRIIVLTEK